MKKLFITFIAIIVSASILYSQNKIIKGRVISNDFENVSFSSIMINDTIEVGKTDLNGFFKIEIPVLEKKLLFRSVGLESAIIEFVDTCNEVEVIMMLSGTYDFMTPKKVDKRRMER